MLILKTEAQFVAARVTQIALLIQHLALAVREQVGILLPLTIAAIKDLLLWEEIPTRAINLNWYKK